MSENMWNVWADEQFKSVENGTALEHVSDDDRTKVEVMLDTMPEPPESDFGYPIIGIEYAGYRYNVEMVGYGEESWKNDGITAAGPDEVPTEIEEVLTEVLRETGCIREAIEAVDMWLGVVHGGSMVEVGRGGNITYVAYDTRAMRESWGLTGNALEASDPEGDEWEAFVEGEVYGIASYYRDDNREWIEAEACWGYYGLTTYVRDEAMNYLDYARRALAKQDAAGNYVI